MNREELQERLKGAVLLAPLTKGGNLPFRRFCVELGAKITVSEMAYARKLIKRDRRERVLLRRHPSEKLFGVQIAARKADEALAAARIVEDSGADFLDINCGCPIDDTTRRGLGAALLQRPKLIGRMLDSLVPNISIPVTVKIRTGWNESSINALETARIAEEGGAAALCIHGRTRKQRYSKAANWEIVAKVADSLSIPVIGNGDIFSFGEAKQHFDKHRVQALMLARGALIKPWLFRDIAQESDISLNAEQRIGLYFSFSRFLLEHFGDDELGRRRIMNFLPWHFSLFCRYREHLPLEEESGSDSENIVPLIHRRERNESLPLPIDRLLASELEEHHVLISECLLAVESAEAAHQSLLQKAVELEKDIQLAQEIENERENSSRHLPISG